MPGLILTQYEVDKRDEILAAGGYDLMTDIEETCEGSRSYHYIVRPSGIGDSVYLVFNGEETFISDPDSF